MKTRPILFNSAMVRAVLDGSKTQTRRPIKPQPSVPYPYYDTTIAHHPTAWDIDGDMWTPRAKVSTGPYTGEAYKGEPIRCPYGVPGDRLIVSPGPIRLEVTGLRVGRVQSISEEDARAEGPPMDGPAIINGEPGHVHFFNARRAFTSLWEGIYGRQSGCSWAENPWVWIVDFKRVTP